MFGLLIALIYLCFISLGLPDSLLGSAWPVMYQEMNVPLSYAGLVSMTISGGTIVSSLSSEFLVRKITAKWVTVFSILLTCVALLGFSFCHKYWMLFVFAVPYGLGAGSIDATLNNYAANHFKSQHVSWLHAAWGVGAAISPYIMSLALTKTSSWNNGYLWVSMIQFCILIIVVCCLPLWKYSKKNENKEDEEEVEESIPLFKAIFMKGVIPYAFCFFLYCTVEQTSMLWGASFLVIGRGFSEEFGAMFASMVAMGIMIGRILNGFLSMKLSDKFLIRCGSLIVFVGICILFIPNSVTSLIGLLLVGLGCSPIFPCLIHSTPVVFGKKLSMAVVGLDMSFAYMSICFMPPLFGLIAEKINVLVLPVFLLISLILLFIMFELSLRKNKVGKTQ